MLIAGGVVGISSPTWAAGTYFVAEGRGGAVTDTGGSDPSLAWGASIGPTLRLGSSPLRVYFLANVEGRRFDRSLDTVGGQADTRQLDLGGSLRLVLPLAGPVRIFGELGAGARRQRQTLVHRSVDLAQEDWTPAGLVGVGLQVRPWRAVSLMTRLGYTWHGGADDLAHRLMAAPTDAITWSVGLGFHF